MTFIKYIKSLILFLFFSAFVFATQGQTNPVGNEPVDLPADSLTIQLNDSISQENPLRIRLQDPNYDVRFEKGSLQPWHDIRSIYLRRTIPVTHLAAIKIHDSV
jgi:hypothetical protein